MGVLRGLECTTRYVEKSEAWRQEVSVAMRVLRPQGTEGGGRRESKWKQRVTGCWLVEEARGW